ncbi:hypothetical protein [Pectinatus frisingensis]|uniref:hypothetical protein n=1 Tax=Pectinatus frisingensis TaxID=865 RepID=UPI0015F5A87B|nr:hypothetical protein [Pectinatus frisingensis]
MKKYFTNIAGFKKRYHSALMYHHRAEQFMLEKQSYIVVFDIASIAVENYLIAICEFYSIDPATHNYQSLMDALEQITDIIIPSDITAQIRILDTAYGICSLENYQRKTNFTKVEISQILHLCCYLSNMSQKILSQISSKNNK